jgi:hypothetical protein
MDCTFGEVLLSKASLKLKVMRPTPPLDSVRKPATSSARNSRIVREPFLLIGEPQRDGNGQKTELTLDQSYSQEDPTMITDSDVPF